MKMSQLASLFLLLVATAAAGEGNPQTTPEPSFSLTVMPGASVPLGPHTDIISPGGAADLIGDFPLAFWPALRIGPAVGYTLGTVPAPTTISTLDFGASVGVTFHLSPQLRFHSEIQGGR
ncbi:MAG TPA: hypothetical protein VMV03_09065 [Spirochaetia bacterium]|nr:hypothetical protein [Spirochaetia bacterium]